MLWVGELWVLGVGFVDSLRLRVRFCWEVLGWFGLLGSKQKVVGGLLICWLRWFVVLTKSGYRFFFMV